MVSILKIWILKQIEVQIQLNSLIKQLHLAYERRNDCIYNIKDNLAKYQEAGVDVSVVFDIDNRSKIYFNKKQDALLGTKLMSYIRSYNYLLLKNYLLKCILICKMKLIMR